MVVDCNVSCYVLLSQRYVYKSGWCVEYSGCKICYIYVYVFLGLEFTLGDSEAQTIEMRMVDLNVITFPDSRFCLIGCILVIQKMEIIGARDEHGCHV